MNKISKEQIQEGETQSYVRRVLTSAEILALHTTPIELVAAPGAGKIIVPVACVCTGLTTGHTPYAGSGFIKVLCGTNDLPGGVDLPGTPFAATDDTFEFAYMPEWNADGSSAGLVSDFENGAINISNVSSAFTGGDAEVVLQMWYNTINIS